MTEPQIEIREVGKPPRVVVVDHVLEIGRDRVGVTIVDDGVSRRHLKLLPSPLGLQVVDLGSRNGTLLNGVPVAGQTNLFAYSFDEFATGVEERGGFWVGPWCGDAACEAEISAKTKASIRFLPFEPVDPGAPCINCGKPGVDTATWARAY